MKARRNVEGAFMGYRWARHRVVDEHGSDKSGVAAISLWWMARAAAEETLQGSPLVAAWLKLFATQLSTTDTYWLRWRGDLAQSAELRRAYSGLYGRFVARALLEQHLGLSRFVALRRNGVDIPGSATVRRTCAGDIPDWIAWDEKNSRFVLGEAKGSLTGTDFLAADVPKCVRSGKAQFERVKTIVSGRVVEPGRWVAATRWATDERLGYPITVLWDPPVREAPFSREEARQHRTAIGRAWLDSIAPGFGWRSADDLMSNDRARGAVLVRAEPGGASPTVAWPEVEQEADSPDFLEGISLEQEATRVKITELRTGELVRQVFLDDLNDSSIYDDRSKLDAPKGEKAAHDGAYIAALVTRFGIQPVRTAVEFEELERAQERALTLEEPAMLIGLPLNLDPASPVDDDDWLDGAGIASTGKLAVFDLRNVGLKMANSLRRE